MGLPFCVIDNLFYLFFYKKNDKSSFLGSVVFIWFEYLLLTYSFTSAITTSNTGLELLFLSKNNE